MYITINDIKGEKTIDLSYPTQNFGSTAGWGEASKEIAVISMLSENTQHEMTKAFKKLKLIDGTEKELLSKTYTSRELNAFVGGKRIISNDDDPRMIKTNKLAKVTNMIFKLDELDNTNNLEDGKPSNTLFTYYMPGFEDFTCFEPKTP